MVDVPLLGTGGKNRLNSDRLSVKSRNPLALCWLYHVVPFWFVLSQIKSPHGSNLSAEHRCKVQSEFAGAASPLYQSMDWFKGNFTGLSPTLNGKIYGFLLRFSPKPIHCISHLPCFLFHVSAF